MTFAKSIARLVLISAVAFTFVACSNSDDSNNNNTTENGTGQTEVTEAVAPMAKTVTIGSYRETCPGTGQLCYMVKEDGKPWEIMSEPIEGFAFAWGRATTVELEILTITDPSVDGPTKIYRVQNVVTQANELPGSMFTMDLNRAYLEPSSECRFVLANETEFSASNPDACRALNDLLIGNKRAVATFRFTGNPEDPFILDTVSDGSIVIPRFWGRVTWETWPARGSGCNKTTELRVFNDGRFEYRDCTGTANGQVTAEELLGISTHVANMQTNTDGVPKVCEPGGENEPPKDFEVLFTNFEKLNMLRTGNEGTCIRGTREPVERMQRHMTRIVERVSKLVRSPNNPPRNPRGPR